MTASGLSLIFDGKEQEKENLRGEKYVYNQFESSEDCTCVNREFFCLARDKNPSVCTFYIL